MLKHAAGRPLIVGELRYVGKEPFVGSGGVRKPLPLPVGQEVGPDLHISPFRPDKRIGHAFAR